MKYLRIKNGKGYFLNSEKAEIEIDKIKRDDILRLLDLASDETINFEIDTIECDNIKNEAHKITPLMAPIPSPTPPACPRMSAAAVQ